MKTAERMDGEGGMTESFGSEKEIVRRNFNTADLVED